jgi:hypothetical protein
MARPSPRPAPVTTVLKLVIDFLSKLDRHICYDIRAAALQMCQYRSGRFDRPGWAAAGGVRDT